MFAAVKLIKEIVDRRSVQHSDSVYEGMLPSAQAKKGKLSLQNTVHPGGFVVI